MSNIGSKWVDGNLIFYNTVDGTTILEIKQGETIPSGTQASLISDLGVTATGTEIATAVNSIIDALQTFGIVATS